MPTNMSDSLSKEKLPNGVTLICDTRKMPVSTIFIATRFGSAYEQQEFKGIAHFIEHMLFKGTRKRTAKQINHEIESVGGEINAFTNNQITAFYAKMPRKHFETGFDVLSDMMCGAVMAPKELEKERKVIFEEIKRKHDTPMQYAVSKVKEMLYLPPFGLATIGTFESLSRINRKHMLDHYSYYSPENLIITVVGDTDADEIKRNVMKKIPSAKHKPIPSLNPVPCLNNCFETRKELQQAHVALGFYMPTLSQKQRYAAEIFDCILGRGMSSRLWQEIREKRGLAYTAHSYLIQEKDYGFSLVYIGTMKEKIKEVKEITFKQIKALQTVDSKDIEDAKENLIGSHEVASERSEEIAMNLLYDEIATEAEEYPKYIERISNVKISEVRELARIKGYGSVILSPK